MVDDDVAILYPSDDQETTEGTTQSTIPLRKTSQEQGPLLSPGPTHVPSNSPMPSVRVHHTPPASPKLRNRRSYVTKLLHEAFPLTSFLQRLVQHNSEQNHAKYDYFFLLFTPNMLLSNIWCSVIY